MREKGDQRIWKIQEKKNRGGKNVKWKTHAETLRSVQTL